MGPDLEAECQKFSRLDNTHRRSTINSLIQRKEHYLGERLSNREIYVSCCEAHGVGVNPDVAAMLSAEALDFSALTLAVDGYNIGTIEVLIDIILLNPIQQLCLRDTNLNNDDVLKLGEALLSHKFITFVDLRGNPRLGPQAGHSLLTLCRANEQIVRIAVGGTSIPADLQTQLAKQCNQNSNARQIGRTEFELLMTEFRAFDSDGDGKITKQDVLRETSARAIAKAGSRNSKSKATGPAGSATPAQKNNPKVTDEEAKSPRGLDQTLSRVDDILDSTMRRLQDIVFDRIDKVSHLLRSVMDDLKDGETWTFPDVIVRVFPSWTKERANDLIAQYSTNSGLAGVKPPSAAKSRTAEDKAEDLLAQQKAVASSVVRQDVPLPTLTEIRDFIAEFGDSNGLITLERLAEGLGEEVESLRSVFNEFDSDHDGRLSMEEFLRLTQA